LKKEVAGSRAVGFTNKDAYNALTVDNKKHLDGTDTNILMEKRNQRLLPLNLMKKQVSPVFFWRDSLIREDCNLFGDVVVFDTTYRTNKYDMICIPFVGINYYNKNIMLGCGFILNEKIKSFIWLFQTLLSSMDEKHPMTIMMEQAPSIAAVIRSVFLQAKHRLYIWHIMKNFKIHIRML